MKLRTIFLLAVLILALAACDASPTLPPLVVDTPTSLPEPATTEPKSTEAPTSEPTVPVVEPTAEPTPIPPVSGCLIAWAGEGFVTCQMEGGEIRTLVSGVPGANTPRVSPSGALVAYRVTLDDLSEQLWLVGVDGSTPRLLIDPTAIPAPEAGFISSIYRFEWLAGDSALVFSTVKVPVSDDIGMYLPYNFDLMTVEVASGTRQTLIAAGSGGMFYLSPNQQYIMVSRAESLDLYNISLTGLSPITSVTFPMIITYSEYNYMPAAFWSPDSTFFTSLVPSSDPMADLPYASIYQVGVDGSTNLLSQPQGNFVFGGGSIQISPDGLWFAKGQYNTLGELVLSLERTDGSASLPVAAMQGLDALGFSADSATLAFTQTTSDTSGSLSTITTGGMTNLVAISGRVLDAHWLDGSTFAYLTQDSTGWKLWLHVPGSGENLLASGAGSGTQFDLR